MRTLALVLLVLTAVVVTTAGRSASSADCSRTSVGFTPLTDLKTGRYLDYQGGLYPGGKNAPSKAYLKQGLAQARLVRPRDASGKPAAGGKVVLLSIGMSNTTMEFSEFKREADADPRKKESVVIVDGAQGGQDAEIVKDANARYWNVVDQRLERSGVTRNQVQAVWLKQALKRPTEQFAADAKRLKADLRAIVALLRGRFPNLRLVYLSSRTYAGYATTALNPEPYAYQSGFAVKWLVQERIADKRKTRPWLAWGPYLWTDGTKGRSDGFTWTCADVRNDGTHPSPTSGAQKVAGLLLGFLTKNSTARSWFG
ncbi:MAG TPA: hypothetical protein VF895_02850 [Gaiellaceae bacterium]